MFDRVYDLGRAPLGMSWEQLFAEPPCASRTIDESQDSMIASCRRMIEEKRSTALIISPHATTHPDLPTLFDSYWRDVPDDWDVVTLGAYFQTPPAHILGHVFRPADFAAIHGFALRDRACAGLIGNPATDSRIESYFSSMLGEGDLKVYSIWPNLICPRDASNVARDHFNSFSKLGHHGRRGNQFFQVAATLGSAARFGYRPQFPSWDSTQILAEHFDQQLNVQRISTTYDEPHFHYVPIPGTPDLDLVGFFQSPRYFAGCENLIRQYLRPSAKLHDAVMTRFAALLSKPTVALHVRRADYVGMAHAFPPLPVEYYRAAMKQFPADSHFTVFSDDPAWCRTAFKDDPVEIITGNPGYADLYLMSACKHQIIANSTFSWWAAYLNPNPDKRIVASKTWFGPTLSQNDIRDLYPPEWILL